MSGRDGGGPGSPGGGPGSPGGAVVRFPVVPRDTAGPRADGGSAGAVGGPVGVASPDRTGDAQEGAAADRPGAGGRATRHSAEKRSGAGDGAGVDALGAGGRAVPAGVAEAGGAAGQEARRSAEKPLGVGGDARAAADRGARRAAAVDPRGPETGGHAAETSRNGARPDVRAPSPPGAPDDALGWTSIAGEAASRARPSGAPTRAAGQEAGAAPRGAADRATSEPAVPTGEATPASPEERRAWEVAAAVLDPEVPCVTVADLGILRSIRMEGGTAVAVLSPTYSGCPAVLAIELAVETALRDAGFEARTERVLTPPWTTDWITDEGREKLRAYGIAPPEGPAGKAALFGAGPVTCPRCGSRDTEELSAFGSTACKAQWRCRSCLEPFDHFKCI